MAEELDVRFCLVPLAEHHVAGMQQIVNQRIATGYAEQPLD